MNDTERNRLETFNRVRDCGASLAADFPAGSLGKQLFSELESVITGLTDQTTVQSSTTRASRQGTHSKEEARAALLSALKEISLTALALALTRPELERKFQLPGRMNDQELLSAGRGFLVDAQPLQSEFISQDHGASFLAQLSAKIGRFEEATKEQQQVLETRVVARGAIRRGIERGMELLQKLDRVMENKYRKEEEVLARWRKARHIMYRQRRNQPAAPVPAPPQPEPLSR